MANIYWKFIICIADLNLYVYFWRENLDATYIGIIFYSAMTEVKFEGLPCPGLKNKDMSLKIQS